MQHPYNTCMMKYLLADICSWNLTFFSRYICTILLALAAVSGFLDQGLMVLFAQVGVVPALQWMPLDLNSDYLACDVLRSFQ